MLTDLKFTNFATATIADAGGISAGDLAVNVASGKGALFPVLTGDAYFYCVIVDASANREIIKVTARSSDAFTIVRAQDNTTARAFSQGDKIELRMTAVQFETFQGEPSQFVNNTNGNPNISDADFDVDSYVTKEAWESVGPTGSGADNIWTALDDVPTDVNWIKVRLHHVGESTDIGGSAGVELNGTVHVRKSGSSEPDHTKNAISAIVGHTYLQGGSYINADARCVSSDEIPVLSGVFDVYYTSGFGEDQITMYLTGYGYN